MASNNKAKLAFWNHQYEFDVDAFTTSIETAVRKRFEQWMDEDFQLFQKNDKEQDIDQPTNFSIFITKIFDQSKKDSPRSGMMRQMVKEEKAAFIDSFFIAAQEELEHLSAHHFFKLSPEEQDRLKAIWHKLKDEKKLCFKEPSMRSLAEIFIGCHDSEEDVDKDLLIELLKSDIALLRSEKINDYIKGKQKDGDSLFLRKLCEVILPERMNHKSQKEIPDRYICDWIFAQIFYDQKITKIEKIEDLFTGIAEEFPKIITKKIPGIIGKPGSAFVKKWYYERKKYYNNFFDDEILLDFVKKSVSPAHSTSA